MNTEMHVLGQSCTTMDAEKGIFQETHLLVTIMSYSCNLSYKISRCVITPLQYMQRKQGGLTTGIKNKIVPI